jgi:hypothetical protein
LTGQDSIKRHAFIIELDQQKEAGFYRYEGQASIKRQAFIMEPEHHNEASF